MRSVTIYLPRNVAELVARAKIRIMIIKEVLGFSIVCATPSTSSVRERLATCTVSERPKDLHTLAQKTTSFYDCQRQGLHLIFDRLAADNMPPH